MNKTYIVNCPVVGNATVEEFDANSPSKQVKDLIKTSTIRRVGPFYCREFDGLVLWEDARHFDKRDQHGKPPLYNRKAEEFLTMKEMGNVVISHAGRTGFQTACPKTRQGLSSISLTQTMKP